MDISSTDKTWFGAFPVELKREIFEITAYQYPLSAVRLAVVSHEVQRWYVLLLPHKELALMD